jgi:hypothetical protein
MMMTWLFLAGVALIFIFSFVVLFGAPFLPTLKARTTDALDLLDLKPGQRLLELGSGDGRILREAAKRGIYATGYELNPLLVMWSWLVSFKYRKFITIKLGNYWQAKWPATDGIYTFLLNPYMQKLDTKITQEIRHDVKVVSFAFKIPDKKAAAELNGMFFYEYRYKAARRAKSLR